MAQNEIIAALKEMTLTDLNELVKAIEEEFGISATPVAVAAGGAGEAEAEAADVDVVIVSAGSAKISVIKAVREITGLGLKEAKEIVDKAGTVKEAVPVADAEELKAKLEEAGATVEFK